MQKIIAICQPNFLPWLGYFEMGHRADVYVMLDDVQYIRREWVNRNRILSQSSQGWQWLTVPLKKRKRESLINEMEISYEQRWVEKMLSTIHHVYKRSTYFGEYFKLIEEIFAQKWNKLIDLNITSIKLVYKILGIQDNLLLSSELKISSKKDDKLADICEKLDASVYMANDGSKPYISQSKFQTRKIGFVFQDYQHPQYNVKNFRFIPFLSVVDLIFWHGPESLNIILEGRKENWRDEITYS